MSEYELGFTEEARQILRDNFIFLECCPACKVKFDSFFDLVISKEKSVKKIGTREIDFGVLICMKCGRSIGMMPEKDVYLFIKERNQAYNRLWDSDVTRNRMLMKKILENVKLTGALGDSVIFTIRPLKKN